MRELFDYQRGDYLEDRRLMRQVRDLVPELCRVFTTYIKDGQWPYELRNGEVPEWLPSRAEVTKGSRGPSYSFSTNAMIAFSLGVLGGSVGPRFALVPRTVVPPIDEELQAKAREAVDRFVRESAGEVDQIAYSSTFGRDDPLTLSWLLGLRPLLKPDFTREVVKRARRITKLAVKSPGGTLLDHRPDSRSLAVPHAFLLLRAVQIADALSGTSGLGLVADQFDRTLHLHLSRSAIPDAEFDAAEMVFAMEGLLLSEQAVDAATTVRMFEVLAASQERTPYWRPLKPFVASKGGQVLLPLSVEIANSLLRICAMVDSDEGPEPRSYFSQYLPLLKRYASWLLSRLQRGEAPTSSGGKPQPFVGWRSEHLHDPGTIHLWETSQVLLFLEFFAQMLQAHIGRTSLQAARFDVERPVRKISWDEVCEQREPVTGLSDDRYQVFRQIGRRYAAGSGRSFLLYGPPGTGKTSLVRLLAAELGRPLLQLSPSDFVAGGEAEVEVRARAIFDALTEQRDVVVLFDEIDRLLLDRDSQLYEEQNDIFQFMTPGMLTKIKALHDQPRVTFIIATNYAERIDPAVKRAGRLDDRYLLLPPDRSRRRKIMSEEAKEAKGRFTSRGLDAAAKATALLTYGELAGVVRRAAATDGAPDSVLKSTVDAAQPLLSLSAYRQRITDEKTKQRPWDELLLMAYLWLESHPNLGQDAEWIAKQTGDHQADLAPFLTDAKLRSTLAKDAQLKEALAL